MFGTKRMMAVGIAAASGLALSGGAAHADFLDEVYYNDWSSYSQGIGYPSEFEQVSQNRLWVFQENETSIGGVDFRIEGDDGGNDLAYVGTLDDGSDPFGLADYRVFSKVRQGNHAFGGIIGRYQDEDNFYHARIDRSGTSTNFQLLEFKDGDHRIESVGGVPSAGFVELIMDGSTVIGNFYDSDDPTELLHSLSLEDAAVNSGAFGIRSTSGGAAVWEDLGAYVPEPGSLALLGAGGALMLLRRRR